MENKKPIVQLKNITKYYGENQVLKPISLDIYEGEFLTLLGSSGCGKTTTLRIIAGFEMPTEGEVILEDADVTELPPYNRNVNTVFQSYALFPHMNVYDNVAFGLVEKKMDKKEIKEKVTKILDLVQLSKFGKRKPSQMSGGQKQRVAIARALVTQPSMILADEPTGNLDSKTGEEIMALFHELHDQGNTIVLITHDENVANQAERRIRIRDGRVQEVDLTPELLDRTGKGAQIL